MESEWSFTHRSICSLVGRLICVRWENPTLPGVPMAIVQNVPNPDNNNDDDSRTTAGGGSAGGGSAGSAMSQASQASQIFNFNN